MYMYMYMYMYFQKCYSENECKNVAHYLYVHNMQFWIKESLLDCFIA